ncbi:hypothetical protein DFH06DRAFT_1180100 [Mycena polygramma]|nr:hypothetical protein DFH06DRAFT_1180100 [Mycena polygramma]
MVHPTLLSRNFARLPPYLLSRVSAAVHGTLRDLVFLCDDLRTIPEDQLILLLPLFFIHLDPSLIPTAGQLDATRGTAPLCKLQDTVERGVESLNGLSTLADLSLIPIDASPDLWPRVWPWMEFFQMYWECLPGVPHDAMAGRMRMASILAELKEHPQTAVLISRTRGVRQIFAQVWAHTLQNRALASHPSALTELYRVLHFLNADIQNPTNLADIVDGLGNAVHLILVLKMHIAHACAAPPSGTAIGALGAAIKCVLVLHGDYKDLHPVLLSEGIVVSLVTALNNLSQSLVTEAASVAYMCFRLLENILLETAQLALALEGGLLPSIVRFVVPANGRDAVHVTLKTLLSKVLPSGLTSHRVVQQMKTSISDGSAAAQNAEFQRSSLFEDWTTFMRLAESRVKVLDVWEAAGKPLLQACDNLKCGSIKPRSEFKTCSACSSAIYCCRQCQITDWRDAHRDDCITLLAARQHFALPFRERAFLRVLFHSDHQRMREATACRLVDYIREYPQIPCFTAYNYAQPSEPTFEIGHQGPLAEMREHLGPDWELQWRRLARAKGRMELNLLILPQGFTVFPTRSSSSKFRDGLTNIAAGPDREEEARVHDLIQAVRSDPDFVEIH